MDSFTQLALGATVGYAVAGKQLGKKALLWGAFAGTLPDLDFIPTLPFNDEFIYLKYHRGFSHSLIFSFLGPAAIAWLVKTFVSKLSDKFWPLFWLFFWGISTHILLDCFTSWGTQVFWPIKERISFHSIFIIDPAYTLPLVVCFLALIFGRQPLQTLRTWAFIGLTVTSLYLGWSLTAKAMMNHHFDRFFQSKGIQVERMMTRPSPFNTILWSTTAETTNGYYFAMASLFDKKPPQHMYFTPKNHGIVVPFLVKSRNNASASAKISELVGYTHGFYSAATTPTGVVIHDMRYGFLGAPWYHGENFVFSYYLDYDEHHVMKLRVKNPRPENTGELMKELWERVKGNG